MFFELPDGSHVNLARIYRVVFDSPHTKLYLSPMAHDFFALEGDRVADILAASTKARR